MSEAALAITSLEFRSLDGEGIASPLGSIAKVVKLGTRLNDLAAANNRLDVLESTAGAAEVGIADANGYFTGDVVEEALDELGAVRTYRATGTIANAAVRTLNATPVQMIAAPGSGKAIRVIRCEWMLDYVAPAFDAAASGDTLGAKYTNGSGAQCLQTLAGNTIGAASADYRAFVGAANTVIPVENAAVVAHIDTGEWYGAAGGSALKYAIEYQIVTLIST